MSHFGSISAHFGSHFGAFRQSFRQFRHHFGTISAPFRHHFGTYKGEPRTTYGHVKPLENLWVLAFLHFAACYVDIQPLSRGLLPYTLLPATFTTFGGRLGGLLSYTLVPAPLTTLGGHLGGMLPYTFLPATWPMVWKKAFVPMPKCAEMNAEMCRNEFQSAEMNAEMSAEMCRNCRNDCRNAHFGRVSALISAFWISTPPRSQGLKFASGMHFGTLKA